MHERLKIGEIVRLFRVLSCLTQDDLSIITGTNQKYIANIELNKFKSSPTITEKISLSLQLSTNIFLGYNRFPIFRSPIVYYSLAGEHMTSKPVNDTTKSLTELLPRFIAYYGIKECFHSPRLSTFNFIVDTPNTHKEDISDGLFSLMIIHAPVRAFPYSLYGILADFSIHPKPLIVDNAVDNIPKIDDRAIAAFLEHLKRKYIHLQLKKLSTAYEKERLSRQLSIEETIITGISDNVFKTLSRFNLPCRKLLRVLSERCEAQYNTDFK